jgi:hypothetical protein
MLKSTKINIIDLFNFQDRKIPQLTKTEVDHLILRIL